MTTVDGGPRLLAVGTATPPESFSQQELLDRFGITDRATVSVFRNSHIERRNLYLAARGPTALAAETHGELLDKHLAGALEMGEQAIRKCLAEAGRTPDEVDYLCCVTSTGFLCPSLSARFIKRLGMRADVSRVDVVGMGCNAGLNGLNPVSSWATANPGGLALMLCVEVCSAAYAHDGTMRTAVVNALFGDGAAAVLVGRSAPAGPAPAPELVAFRSHVLTDALSAMRFDWDADQLKYSFYLDRRIPYVIGAHTAEPVTGLLARHGLAVEDVDHWVVHSGGKKVIDGIKYNLDLTEHDLRHTTSVLRDHGNLSSGSFLFSYERLLRENVVRAGDHGVMMTMGPGTTIETALLRW